MQLSEEEWKAKLSPEQYYILRQKGTEAPFTGDLLYNDKVGTYTCAACGAQLFESGTKFDAHCGWPSFYDVKDNKAVTLLDDSTLGMSRVEVQCANCGGHLGHVFEDAPEQPTGQRYCINSVSIAFEPKV